MTLTLTLLASQMLMLGDAKLTAQMVETRAEDPARHALIPPVRTLPLSETGMMIDQDIFALPVRIEQGALTSAVDFVTDFEMQADRTRLPATAACLEAKRMTDAFKAASAAYREMADVYTANSFPLSSPPMKQPRASRTSRRRSGTPLPTCSAAPEPEAVQETGGTAGHRDPHFHDSKPGSADLDARGRCGRDRLVRLDRTMLGKHEGDHGQLLRLVEQRRIVERHQLHIFEKTLGIAEFGNLGALSPDRCLVTFPALAISAMAKLAMLDIVGPSLRDLR